MAKMVAEWLTEEGLQQLKVWARDGLTNAQIAQNIGVRAETLSRWATANDKIARAIKEGRRPVINQVEDAFYGRCQWRQVEETRDEETIEPDGARTVKHIVTKRWVPPEAALLIFALKNLRPDKWRDKPQTQADSGTSEAFERLISAIEGSGK